MSESQSEEQVRPMVQVEQSRIDKVIVMSGFSEALLSVESESGNFLGCDILSFGTAVDVMSAVTQMPLLGAVFMLCPQVDVPSSLSAHSTSSSSLCSGRKKTLGVGSNLKKPMVWWLTL
ncbi:hypothetical protein STEG23_036566 [Scotinomys teguina]